METKFRNQIHTCSTKFEPDNQNTLIVVYIKIRPKMVVVRTVNYSSVWPLGWTILGIWDILKLLIENKYAFKPYRSWMYRELYRHAKFSIRWKSCFPA